MRLRGMECRAPSGHAEAFYSRKLAVLPPPAGSSLGPRPAGETGRPARSGIACGTGGLTRARGSTARWSSSRGRAAATGRPPLAVSPGTGPSWCSGRGASTGSRRSRPSSRCGDGAAVRDGRHAGTTQVRHLVDHAVETHGRIDVIVNNAGVMPHSPLERRKVADWDRMIDVNLRGVAHGIAAALPHMTARRSGHIINVSSVAGHKVRPGQRGLRRDQDGGAHHLGGTAAGGQALQHPHHRHLGGCRGDRAGGERHRARRGRERSARP